MATTLDDRPNAYQAWRKNINELLRLRRHQPETCKEEEQSFKTLIEILQKRLSHPHHHHHEDNWRGDANHQRHEDNGKMKLQTLQNLREQVRLLHKTKADVYTDVTTWAAKHKTELRKVAPYISIKNHHSEHRDKGDPACLKDKDKTMKYLGWSTEEMENCLEKALPLLEPEFIYDDAPANDMERTKHSSLYRSKRRHVNSAVHCT